MIHTILSLILVTNCALAQIDAVKPDFSDTHNSNRFDMASMMRAHDKMYRDTPLVYDDEEGVASDADSRRHLQNDDTALLAKLQQTRRNNKMNLDIPLADADYRRHDTPNADIKILLDSILQGKDPLHPFRRVDETGFAVDDRFNSFEGGSVSDFEENLKKFYTYKPSTGKPQNDVEEITEREILLENAATVMDGDGYSKPPLEELTDQ